MIYFVGDVHALFRHLAAQMDVAKIRNSTLIQVGDFGAGFKRDEEKLLEELNHFLFKTNNQLYVLRGNHDNPSYFYDTGKIGNITFLKDYSILEVEENIILLVGGAISIDRTNRVEGSSYWRDEAFNFDEGLLNSAVQGLARLDIVVTHNAPSEFWPYQLNNLVEHYLDRDKTLRDDLANERTAHSNLMKHTKHKGLNPTHWYYGHFQANYNDKYEGISYRALDELEIYAHR